MVYQIFLPMVLRARELRYYSTNYFPSSSYVAEITHPFAGADWGSLRMPTDIFISLSYVIA